MALVSFDFNFNLDLESAFRPVLQALTAFAVYVALVLAGIVKTRTVILGLLILAPVALLAAALVSDLPGIGVGVGIFLLVLWAAVSAAQPER